MPSVRLLSAFPSPQTSRLNPLEAAKGFASDIVLRAEASGRNNNAPGQTSEIADRDIQQVREFEKSLQDTIHYLAQNHGKSAASAAMGIIYKSIGENQVTETTIGEALLDVTHFIDANFGFKSGDSFIEHLNEDLNDSLNNFFQNGKNEQFIAITTIDGKTHSTVPSDASSLTGQSLVQTISEDLTELSKVTGKILKTIQEKRIEPEARVLGTAYSNNRTALPTGVMLNTTA